LLVSLHLARSEAIKRNSRAVVCPSADGSHCAVDGAWHLGWLVFHDANNNAAREDGEEIVHRRQALSTGLRVGSTGSTARYVSYESSGGTRQVSGAFQAGTLTLCSKSGDLDAARQIVISRTGRPRTVKLDACP
jgi:type IV fimbrial biogenesis protein FimT